MPSGDANAKADRKNKYGAKITKLMDQYTKILIVGIDNIGSDHMQRIRRAIRGKAELVCGKNSLVRRQLRLILKANPDAPYEQLVSLIKGNVALVFTKGNLSEVRKSLLELKVEAPAKVGAVSPNQVVVPKGPTGMEPTKTSFLQALNISSKINKGQIEIINDKILIEAGQKVGQSEAALLQMLNIKPFSYALTIKDVYDNGSIYDPSILNIEDSQIVDKIKEGIQRVAGLSLALSIPTLASFPHVVANGYKNVLSIALGSGYTFPRAEAFKNAASAPQATKAEPVQQNKAPEKKKEEKPKEEEKQEEEDDEEVDMGGGGMFGDDEGW